MTAREFIEIVEQALSHAVEQQCAEAVTAVQTLAALLSGIPYTNYPTSTLLALLPGPAPGVKFETIDLGQAEIAGNAALSATLLDAIQYNLLLGPGAEFHFTLAEASHTPGLPPTLCLVGRFEGPGVLPEKLSFQRYFQLSLNELGGLWTRATRNGRIDRTETGVTLWLKGARVPDPPLAEAAEVSAMLDTPDLLSGAKACLRHLDGNAAPQAANALLPLREALQDKQALLDDLGITLTLREPSALAPLVIRRQRLRAYWDAFFAFILWQPESVRQVEIEIDYDARQRECSLQTTLIGTPAPTHHLASMRRALEDLGGSLLEEFAPKSATLLAMLPDTAGKSLDEWIPGWETFSERSRQMLRLLRGGGPVPPEELILGGVLEDELERRLLPRLALPAARNIAKDLEGRAKGFASAERLAKALGQVSRGKPKKEICAPVYAAELVVALSSTERGRALLGLEAWNMDMLQECCRALADTPARPAAALGHVARWPLVS